MKKKIKQYSTGGEILGAAASFIPGIGPIAGPLVGLIDKLMSKQNITPTANPMQLNTDIYGKMFYGGPVLSGDPTKTSMSRESTYVQPVPFVQPVAPTTPFLNITASDKGYPMIPVTKMPGYDPTSSGPNKSKSKFRFVERALGGLATSNFKQYNTGSHASGNDQAIDGNGNPSANAQSSIQNKENAYTQNGQTYVYSDVLINPETKRKFNIDAGMLNKKFNSADTKTEERNALDFTMNRLSKANDIVRTVKESLQKAFGGPIKKMEGGGDPVRNRSWVDANGVVHEPDNQLTIEPILNNETGVPFGYNPLTPPNPEPFMVSNYTVDDPGNYAATDNTTFNPTTSNKTATSPTVTGRSSGSSNTNGFNANIPALILKGAGLAKSINDAFTSAEVESPILTDYSKSDKQMYNMSADLTQSKQDALAASNLAGNVNRSASSNFGQYQGRQANNFANLGDQMGRISMQESQMRNQISNQLGALESQKAQDNANVLRQTKIYNQQNQANADFADEKLFTEFTNIGDSLNKFEETKKQIADNKQIQQSYANQAIALINSKYSNFQLAPDLVERLKTGSYNIDDIVKVKMQIDSKK